MVDGQKERNFIKIQAQKIFQTILQTIENTSAADFDVVCEGNYSFSCNSRINFEAVKVCINICNNFIKAQI